MEDQKQEEGKELKSYENNLKKLVAILGSEKPLTGKKKLPKDELSNVVESLFKEEREAQQLEIRTEIKNLVTKKIEMDRAFRAKQEELDKLKKEKYKEFSEAANKLFNKIDGISDIEKSYYDALGEVKEQQS